MIAAHSLSKNFGRFQAVDSLEFRIPRGQVVGFLGPNGAGKTTTIRMIAGFLPPSGGRVEVDSLDVALHARAVHQRIGYLPEAAPLYGEMRVGEYLKFRARLFALPGRRRRGAIELALRRCALQDVRRRPIHQLSRGYRQRVGLAAALLHEPPVLILDEPTVGLDPAQILEVRRLLRELADSCTVLLSTHILPEVEAACDRVLMIARGRIWADGAIADIRRAHGGDASLTVEVDRQHAAAAEQAVAAIGGVRSVRAAPADGGWMQLSVSIADANLDLREPVARAAARCGGTIRELHRNERSLEEIFVRIVAEAEADFARRQAAREGDGE